MKGFMRSVPKVIVKLLAMLFSPILRLFTLVYKIVAFFLSYGCIGFSLVCLLGAGAEFYNIGATKYAFTYLAMAALCFVARWIILRIVLALVALQGYIDTRAAAPIRGTQYDYHDCFYSYL